MPDLFLVPLLVIGGTIWTVGISLAVVSAFFAGVWYGATRYTDRAERTGARFWRCSRRLALGRCLRWWYGYERTGRLPSGPCIYAVSPHGMVTAATVLTFLVEDEQMDEATATAAIVTHKYMLSVPLVPRELALWLGCVVAGTDVARELLVKQRRSLVVIPGGAHELLPTTGQEVLETHAWLLERVYERTWGDNVSLVPVWAPDEHGVTWAWRCPWPWPITIVLAWLQRHLEWPVLQTLFVWPRLPRATHRFRVRIGKPIHPRSYPTYDAFAQAYANALTDLRK